MTVTDVRKDPQALTMTITAEFDAPVERVCSAEVPMPYAKHLEDAALPQIDAIVAAARRLVRPQ